MKHFNISIFNLLLIIFIIIGCKYFNHADNEESNLLYSNDTTNWQFDSINDYQIGCGNFLIYKKLDFYNGNYYLLFETDSFRETYNKYSFPLRLKFENESVFKLYLIQFDSMDCSIPACYDMISIPLCNEIKRIPASKGEIILYSYSFQEEGNYFVGAELNDIEFIDKGDTTIIKKIIINKTEVGWTGG